MRNLNRRKFMNCCARTGSAAVLGRLGMLNALASTSPSSSYQALVCIFLYGGNDCHNTLIPWSGQNNWNQYNQIRASSGIGFSQAQLNPTLITDGNNSANVYALHPSLPNMTSLYNSGRAAILANVGNLVAPNTNSTNWMQNQPGSLFAHANQQNQWQSGYPDDLHNLGWAGLAADLAAGNNPAYYGASQTFPINLITGENGIFAYGRLTLPTSASAGNVSAVNTPVVPSSVLSFNNGLQLVQAHGTITNNGYNQQLALVNAIAQSGALTNSGIAGPFGSLVYPDAGGIASQLQLVAQIISAAATLGVTRQIFFCSQGSYDTHGSENAYGSGQGALLQALDQAINAFYQATVNLNLANSVTTFTNSEFGRTMQVNPNAGTDHAWGGHQFIIGGSQVMGGKLYGTFPQWGQGSGDQNLMDILNTNNVIANSSIGNGIMIPTTSIVQYGATLTSWFGVASSDIPTVFPAANAFGLPTAPLGFLA